MCVCVRVGGDWGWGRRPLSAASQSVSVAMATGTNLEVTACKPMFEEVGATYRSGSAAWSCALRPAPCTLCPAPCTLCPAPCALCPVPCAKSCARPDRPRPRARFERFEVWRPTHTAYLFLVRGPFCLRHDFGEHIFGVRGEDKWPPHEKPSVDASINFRWTTMTHHSSPPSLPPFHVHLPMACSASNLLQREKP